MWKQNDNPLSIKDRLDKARLIQQVRQEETDPIDDLTSLVFDGSVQLIPNDEATIAKQVQEIELFFFDKYNLKYQDTGGRPAKIQPTNITKLVKLLGLWFSIVESCQQCGLSYMAYYRFLDHNPGFRDTFTQVKQSYLAYLARRNLATLLIEWDPTATFRWLEANDPLYKKNQDGITINNNTQNNLVNVDAKRGAEILESLQKKRAVLESWKYGRITTNKN